MIIENSVIKAFVESNDVTELKLHIGQKRRHMYRRKNAFKKSRKRQQLMKAKDLDFAGADMDMSKNLPDGFLHYDSWRNRVRLENRSNGYKVKRAADRRRLESWQTKINDYDEWMLMADKPYAENSSYDEQQNYCWLEALKQRLVHYGATREDVDAIGIRELLYLADKAGIKGIDYHLYEEAGYSFDDFGEIHRFNRPVRLGTEATRVLNCIEDSLVGPYWYC